MRRATEVAAWLSRTSQRRWLTLIFVVALCVRLAYLLEVRGTPFCEVLLGDAANYDAWAQQIQKDWIGREVFFQAPLYPYFLAVVYSVFGQELEVVRVVQVLLGSLSCVLLARASCVFFSKRVGLVSGLVLAVYGPALFFDGLLQKASLDLFLTTLLLHWLSRIELGASRKFPALAGVTLGCLALTRENALVWLPCLLAWFALRPGHARASITLRRQIAPFVLGVGLVLSLVASRNYLVGGQFFLTTSQFGQNFYIGNNAQADGTYQSLRFGHGGARFERQDAIELAEQALGRPLNASEVSHYWSARALAFIRREPVRWLRSLGKKWFLVWSAREIPDSDEPLVYADESTTLTVASALVSFGTVCPLALLGALVSLRERRRFLVLHAMAVTLAAGTALFFVVARYRYPLVPLLIPFAVLGGFEAWHWFRGRQYRQLAIAFGIVLVGVGVTRLRLVPVESPRATAYYDLGVSLEQLERPSEAQVSYRRALSARPDFVEAHINLGALYARAGKLDEAAEHERAALRLAPDDPLAHANLGNVLLEQGQLGEAAVHYLRAQKLDPHLTQARDGLAAIREQIR